MLLANCGNDNMDYEDLAAELMRTMRALGAAKRLGSVQEGVQGEAFILHLIRESGSDVLPSMISEAMRISSARVAAALNSLENKGMITREIDIEDRRRIIVKITEKGIEHAEEQKKRHIAKIKDILVMMGDRDAKEFVRLLGRLADAFSCTSE